MTEYLIKHYDDLAEAALVHLQLVLLAMVCSLVLAAALTVVCSCSGKIAAIVTGLLAMIYSVPSLAMFALLIPLTGLGKTTAVIVLVIYNQYLLLQNFLAGLDSVDKGVTEAAAGMGMTNLQILIKIRLPLAREALAAGIRIALVSTVSIATIAASINAGGLGTILFDGLRTMNIPKIVWGSLASALLVILTDRATRFISPPRGPA